jgi:hypothetical protein
MPNCVTVFQIDISADGIINKGTDVVTDWSCNFNANANSGTGCSLGWPIEHSHPWDRHGRIGGKRFGHVPTALY